jgi:hypothetical protein
MKRFWDKVDLTGDCWEWTASTNRGGGYGQFWLAGKMVSAHRLAYEMLVGPIPDGLQLDHLCRNRACVKPSHLEPVTLAENLRRGAGKNTETCRKGLHAWTEENIYVYPNGNKQCIPCRNATWRRWRARQDTK